MVNVDRSQSLIDVVLCLSSVPILYSSALSINTKKDLLKENLLKKNQSTVIQIEPIIKESKKERESTMCDYESIVNA